MDALDNWRKLNKILNSLEEETVLLLLEREKKNRRRMMFLQRLHQRYNALRVARERVELMQHVAIARTYHDKAAIKSQTAVNQNQVETATENQSAGALPSVSESVSGPLSSSGFSEGEAGEITLTKKKMLQFSYTSVANYSAVIGEPALHSFLASKAENDRLPVSFAIPDLEKRNEEAVFDALYKFDKKCPYCGKDQYRVGIRDKIEIDHFVPISKGGQNVPWNLVPVCKECNRKKRDHLPKNFLPPSVFDAVSVYLTDVKKRYQAEGYDSYTSSAKVANLVKEHELFIKTNSASNFIRELVHLVCVEEAVNLLVAPVSPEQVDASDDEAADESDETFLTKLAEMPFLDYHRVRSMASKRLKIKASALDTLVTEHRRNGSSMKNYGAVVEMVKGRLGIFADGIVGSPLEKICMSLSVGREIPFNAKILASILVYCDWKDLGRIHSREYNSKRHIFCAPEIASSCSKSEIRRMLEINRTIRNS